jgi:signal transduction histidine kinase
MSFFGSDHSFPRPDAIAEGLWAKLARPWWQRLAFRLLLLVLTVCIVPPLSLGILAMRSARVAQEREVRQQNAAITNWGVDKVESYVTQILGNMRLLIEIGNLKAMDPADARPHLSYILSYLEDAKEVSIIDERGRERARVAESHLVTNQDLVSQAESPKYTVPMSGQTYIGPVRTSEFSEPLITVAVPIRNLAEDRVVGVLAAEINLKRLWDDVLSFKMGRGAYLYLVNGNGQLLAHPDFSLVLAHRNVSAAGAVQRFLKGEDESDVASVAPIEYRNYQGVPVIGSYARSAMLGWGVIIEQPTAEAFASVQRMKTETMLILVNAIAVTLVLALICARALTRPLADLERGARLLGAGDFDVRIPIRGQDEISEVTVRFNAMAQQLQEAFQRLRALLHMSSTTSASLELEKVLTTALEQIDVLAGGTQSGIILVEGSAKSDDGTPSATVRTLGADRTARELILRTEEFPNVWNALTTGNVLCLDDIAAIAGTGERALWKSQGLASAILLPLTAKGDALGVLWVGRTTAGSFGPADVELGQTIANQLAIAIDNARLYDALRHASEELVRNERLALIGQLAGGVGHELRNPLGAIGNAAYYLRMKLTGGEDQKVQKHLGILENEVRRANKIVTDLLDFSRVKPPSRTAVNLNDLIQDVLTRQPAPPAIKVQLDLSETLPILPLDVDQVGQVYLNLLSNAFEAMRDGDTLTIRTWSTAEAVLSSVSDTGPGIAPENMAKVFQPLFTTKTKGIGLGLAVSRRLTEANGGTLNVESRFGEGTTFTAAFRIQESRSVNHG